MATAATATKNRARAPRADSGRRSRRARVAFRHAFAWLLVGAFLYAGVLALAMDGDPDYAIAPIIGPSLYCTPLFGLPYVLAGWRRRGRLRRLVYFLPILTLVHVAAHFVVWKHGVATFHVERDGREFARDLVTGGLGGFVGAALAFTALSLLRLMSPAPAARWLAVFATLALAALGAVLMASGLLWTGALRGQFSIAQQILWLETVYLPWQAAFAFFLAWLMRMPRRE